MSHLPCYICIVTLALMLVTQTILNHRTHKELLDRVLESKGMAALPDEHPVADMLNKLKSEAEKPPAKLQQQRVHFTIPGMPEFKSK